METNKVNKLSEFNQNNKSYNHLCDVLYTLFNATARGVTYWRKHKNHICYKCRAYGHIAKDCDNICILCGNLHNGTLCVQSLIELYRKIDKKLTREIIRDPQKIKREILETQQKIEIEKTKDRISEIQKMPYTPKRQKYENLQITHPSCFQHIVPKKQTEPKSNIVSLFGEIEKDDLQKQEKVLRIRLDNFKKRYDNYQKDKLTREQLMKNILTVEKKLRNVLTKILKLTSGSVREQPMKSNVGVASKPSGSEDCDKTGSAVALPEPVFIYRSKQYHVRAPVIPTVLRIKLEGHLDNLKKKYNRTRQFISDLEYVKKTDKEIKGLEEKWNYYNEKVKITKEKMDQKWKKFDEARKRFNKKKNDFYKKFKRFDKQKNDIYKRMKQENNKRESKKEQMFKEAEIRARFQEAQMNGFTGTYRKFKDSYRKNYQ